MQTVFSHIIQKRFSQVNEDVATDALAYILESSDAARMSITKFLRNLDPKINDLTFKTQQVEGNIRPDLWGYMNNEPHVFIENKFWAGLTDNQPVGYLNQLAKFDDPKVLLFVAPSERTHSLWREVSKRINESNYTMSALPEQMGFVYAAKLDNLSSIAITSWDKLISIIEHHCIDEPNTRSDLTQLKALCDSANIDSYIPITGSEKTDQRYPAIMLQIGSISKEVIDKCVGIGLLNVDGLRPQSSWDRIGRYARFVTDDSNGPGFWFGIHLELWKKHGNTPLWIVFTNTPFGQAAYVKPKLEKWASKNNAVSTMIGNDFAMSLDLPVGEDRDAATRNLVDIFTLFSKLI